MKAKKLLINLSVFLLSAFIIVYIMIQLISGLTTDVEYQYVEQIKIEDAFEKTGYLVRSEQIITAQGDGVTNYSVSEAQKVGAKQLIATVFSDVQGVDIQRQIHDIEKKIDILEKSSVDTSYLTSNVSKIDLKIYEHLLSLRGAVLDHELGLSGQYKENLLINFNKRHLITGGSDAFDSQIKALRDQKNALAASLQEPVCSVYSDAPGYFSTLIDGYETIFTINEVENLTVDSYHRLIEKPAVDLGTRVVGKMITDYDWYTLCEVTSAEAEELFEGATYPISYLYSSGKQLDAILAKKVTQTDTDAVVLVFMIEEVPADFDYTRQQTIRIVKKSSKGLSFPHSALRMINGEKGVFVVSGNSVDFKKVDIYYSSQSHYYSKEKAKTDEDYSQFLSRFDRVITEGKNLYVGKILD